MGDLVKILDWLEVICLERYGHKFDIKLVAHSFVLSFAGSQKQIIFPQLIMDFYSTSNHNLPCCFMNVEHEGFYSPIEPILPLPGLIKQPIELVKYQETESIINYDILGLVYWMLSRQEEVGCQDLDIHGRFPSKASHAFKYGYLERPIVDEWLMILGQVIQKTWGDITLKEHRFSMKVSHDVDRPSRFGFCTLPQLVKKIGGSLLKKDFLPAIYAPFIWVQNKKKLHPKDPYNSFAWLMDVSEKHNLRSAFYFICGTTEAKYDADYRLSDKAIRELMIEIDERGHEIGLHPSYATYNNQQSFMLEANQLKQTCQELGINQHEFGGRMHYLRWEVSTMMLWEKARLIYDSTLSYADRPGFRCGTCFEYPAINPLTKEMLQLRIRPLIAMECSIISPAYLGLGTGEEAMEKFLLLKKMCQRVNGCFTLLWHNSEFNGKQRQLYKKIIET